MQRWVPCSSSFFIFNFETLKSSSFIWELEKSDYALSNYTLCGHFSLYGQKASKKSFLYSVQKSFCSRRCMMLIARFMFSVEFWYASCASLLGMSFSKQSFLYSSKNLALACYLRKLLARDWTLLVCTSSSDSSLSPSSSIFYMIFWAGSEFANFLHLIINLKTHRNVIRFNRNIGTRFLQPAIQAINDNINNEIAKTKM